MSDAQMGYTCCRKNIEYSEFVSFALSGMVVGCGFPHVTQDD